MDLYDILQGIAITNNEGWVDFVGYGTNNLAIRDQKQTFCGFQTKTCVDIYHKVPYHNGKAGIEFGGNCL